MILIDRGTAVNKIRELAAGVPRGHQISSPSFQGWRQQVITALGTIFGDDSRIVQQFEAISFKPHGRLPYRASEVASNPGWLEELEGRHEHEGFIAGCERARKMLEELQDRLGRMPEAHPEPTPSSQTEPRHTMLHTTKAEALAKLNAALSGIPKTKDHTSMMFTSWQSKTLANLKAIFGDCSDIVRHFEIIRFRSGGSTRGYDERSQRLADIENEKDEREAYQFGCERAQKNLEELVEVVSGEPDVPPNPAAAIEAIAGKKSLSDKVFIVHGHDSQLRLAVRSFIKELGLDPIILDERPNRGRTVIEKFEREATVVGYAVVLATGDDLAASKAELTATGRSTSDLDERARQNVVFELGYFVGTLGRGFVTLITEPSVQIPSDLAGVVYTLRHEWQKKMIGELVDVGYAFTPNQIASAMSIRD